MFRDDPEDWVFYADTTTESEDSDTANDDDEFKDDRDWVLAPFEYRGRLGQVVVMNSLRFVGLAITLPFRMYRVVDLGTLSRRGYYMVHELKNSVVDTTWTGWNVSNGRHRWVLADACFGDVTLFREDGDLAWTVAIANRRSIIDFVARGDDLRHVRLDQRR